VAVAVAVAVAAVSCGTPKLTLVAVVAAGDQALQIPQGARLQQALEVLQPQPLRGVPARLLQKALGVLGQLLIRVMAHPLGVPVGMAVVGGRLEARAQHLQGLGRHTTLAVPGALRVEQSLEIATLLG